MVKRFKTLKETFEARIRITPGCWIWTGSRTKNGKRLPYGKLKFKGKHLFAHRVSYTLYVEEIPEAMFVLHKCDVPFCCNPDHLFIGTHGDNMADKVAKDRQAKGSRITGNRNHAKRERHGRAILTEKDVEEIRNVASVHHHYGRAELARKYGVSESAIKAIKSGKLWKPNDK